MLDFPSELSTSELFASSPRTTTTNGTAADLSNLVGRMMILLSSAAGTGTTPTLDIKLQDSADNSTFADVSGATFTQVTGAASFQSIAVDTRAIRRYLRAVATIGGTTPSFSFTVIALYRKAML
jgi:hypothetical protein